MVKEFKKGAKVVLSQNFNSQEFDCKGKNCCSATKIDSKLIDILQKIRNHFGKSVIINSGFRCEKHNKAVGGAKSSLHKSGMAADIVVKGVKPIDVAIYAEALGVKGIGLYSWGCHIDTRSHKAFWVSDKQLPKATFIQPKIDLLSWQKAAILDGFSFKKYGADGVWGSESEAVAKKAICKKQLIGYKNKNLTRLIQKALGITADGLFGKNTKQAVKTYQSEQRLTADGIVGLNTWKKLLGVEK